MSQYSLFNLMLASLVLPLSWLMLSPGRRIAGLALAARVGFIASTIGFYLDFFGIYFKTWEYPVDPGPKLYGVPINDIFFMWLCSVFACCVLIRTAEGRQADSDSHPECKNRDT